LDTNAPLPYDAKWCSSQTARILESGGPCAYPIYHVKVLSNGDVKFCSCVDYDNISENTIGNVATSSLSEIYNGDPAKKMWRKGLVMCKGCTHRKPLSELKSVYIYFDNPMQKLGI